MMLRSKNRSKGFSLVEILMAMVILSVGLLAIIGMIVSASLTANSNKVDTTATMLADTVLEQISAKDITVAGPISIKDCANTDHSVSRVSGAAPGGAGAPLTGGPAYSVDYTAAAVANYQMNYVVCGAAGVRNTFDIRWNIMDMDPAMPNGAGGYAKVVTVSARQLTRTGIYNPPVTLRTVSATQ
jgi:prepilin-type N-terminal cleavage/methylation domain-containing protein